MRARALRDYLQITEYHYPLNRATHFSHLFELLREKVLMVRQVRYRTWFHCFQGCVTTRLSKATVTALRSELSFFVYNVSQLHQFE